MFGSKKNENGTVMSKSNVASPSNALNSLVQGTEVTGTIKAANDFRIDGSLKGDLVCDSKVIIGASGFVDGEVTCENALIEGKFEGTLVVKDMLQIRTNASVSGDISYGKLEVDAGAEINGTCKMINSSIKHKSKKEVVA